MALADKVINKMVEQKKKKPNRRKVKPKKLKGIKVGKDPKLGIQRTPVDSSNIASAGYDEDLKVMEIEFIGGALYQYENVPEKIFLTFMNAPSQGQYFHAKIKPKYTYSRIK